MKKVKSMLRGKNLRKAILFLLLAAILVGGLLAFKLDYKSLFSKECIVEKQSDIDRCKGRFVKVKTSTVYDTEFLLIVDGESKGHFIDIDIEGKTLIGIVKMEDAKKLFGEGEKVITGKLDTFTEKAMKDGYDEIVKKYIEEFGGEATEEEVKNIFIPVQLNAYNANRYLMLIPFLAIVIPLTVVLVLFVVFLIRSFFIRVKQAKDINQNEVEQELDKGPYLYRKDNFIITNHYVVGIKSRGIEVAKIDELVWIYERKVRQLGSSVHKLYLIMCFENRRKMKIKFIDTESEKVIQLLNYKRPNIKTGFSKESLKEWQAKN